MESKECVGPPHNPWWPDFHSMTCQHTPAPRLPTEGFGYHVSCFLKHGFIEIGFKYHPVDPFPCQSGDLRLTFQWGCGFDPLVGKRDPTYLKQALL